MSDLLGKIDMLEKIEMSVVGLTISHRFILPQISLLYVLNDLMVQGNNIVSLCFRNILYVSLIIAFTPTYLNHC